MPTEVNDISQEASVEAIEAELRNFPLAAYEALDCLNERFAGTAIPALRDYYKTVVGELLAATETEAAGFNAELADAWNQAMPTAPGSKHAKVSPAVASALREVEFLISSLTVSFRHRRSQDYLDFGRRALLLLRVRNIRQTRTSRTYPHNRSSGICWA